MTKIMPIQKITDGKQGNVNTKMSRRKSNKMVAIDEKERADRIAAAEAMSALSSMVILSTPTPVHSRENVPVVTRVTSPINIANKDGKTRVNNEIDKKPNRVRGIPTNVPVTHCEQAVRIITRTSPLTPKQDGKIQGNIPTKSQELGITLSHQETRNESSRDKSLPLKKRALAREMDEKPSPRPTGGAGDGHPPGPASTARLPSGTELISGGSQPTSQGVYRFEMFRPTWGSV